MADTITKILFRKGLDITRRTGGGFGVVLNEGEPGFCLDTGRLYVGDGDTVGGRHIGTVNHGTVKTITGSDINLSYYSQAAYSTLTANGFDVGDILFEKDHSIMCYASSKDSFSIVPALSDLGRFSLIGTLSSTNGISNVKTEIGTLGSVIAHYYLNPTYFTVAGNMVTIKTQFTVDGAALFNDIVNIAGVTTINNSLKVQNPGSVITCTGSISSAGVVYSDDGSNGHTSNHWYNSWTNLQENSAGWEGAQTLLNGLTPFAWTSPIGGSNISFTQNTGGVTTAAKLGINVNNTVVVGLAVKGTNTTTTALSVQGAIEASGDITAFSTSDERLKTNIVKIGNALDIIDSIQGVEFDWNCEWKSGPDAGVIAQQVEEVFPIAVITRGDGYKAVNYDILIPLLIQCIKELKAKLNE